MSSSRTSTTPSGWSVALLGELCDVGIGRTPARDRQEYWGPGSPWLSIADMNQGRDLDATAETITDLAIKECNCRLVPTGTVLLSFKLSIGKVGITRRPLFTNEAIAALPIKDTSKIIPDFLYWALRSIDLKRGLDRAAKGLTLNRDKLLRIRIPIPPLSEQRRIAEILDRADALRAKRRAALARLDTLTQSIFLEMFGDPQAHRWSMSTIASVTAPIDNAIRTGPFGSQLLHSEFTDEGIAVLGIDNVVKNEFRWAQRRHISEAKYHQLVRYTVRPGDVLITIMGTCGRCAIVPDDIPTAINTKHLCCITLDHTKCLPVFLHAYFLRHPIARRYLAQKAKGAIMDGLNMGIIKEMPIPLAPIALQEELGRKLTALIRLKSQAEHFEDECNELFISLQQRAFRGEL